MLFLNGSTVVCGGGTGRVVLDCLGQDNRPRVLARSTPRLLQLCGFDFRAAGGPGSLEASGCSLFPRLGR
jgi:hypothetical protein